LTARKPGGYAAGAGDAERIGERGTVVKVAFVGAGGIARAHARCLRENPRAEIVGVVDTNREAAERFAAEHGGRAFDDLDACLGEVDAVYVLTPPSFHREYSVAAMEAGRHVFCEKPISIALDDARAMVDAAKRNRAKLMLAFNHRFRRGFRRLKEVVDSRSLGRVVSFWSQRIGMGIPRSYNWRTDPELLCGMSIESLSHDIDVMRWIVGEVADVRANVVESQADIPGFDDNANVVMTLASGGTALIHASWSSHLGRNSRGVIGTTGAAYLEGPGLWTLATFRWKTDDMAEAEEETLDETDVAYTEENAHFIDCVADDREPSVTGADGLAALRISHAILRSHREKVVVAL
jgi:myo-inositol 2-dehydrogenase/D-chiro-inositol 1-dehydrogenase